MVGWGRDEESWSIDFRVIPGDPSAPALWDELDAYLLQRWPHLGAPDGMALSAACVDTGGHNTMAAYEFVKPRQKRRVWGIKGASDYRAPIWPKRPGRTNKGKIDLYSIGVHAAKDVIYKRLARTGPEFAGAGACHFPADRDAGYFEQLTAEVKRTKFIRGFPVPFFWKPDHARNEALDCRVYAYAALHGLFALGLKLNATAEQIAGAVEAAKAAGPVQPTSVVPLSPRLSARTCQSRLATQAHRSLPDLTDGSGRTGLAPAAGSRDRRPAMATLDEEIAALREAIASGALKVRSRVNGVEKEVAYASYDDLRKRLDFLRGQQAGGVRRKAILAAVHSGRS